MIFIKGAFSAYRAVNCWSLIVQVCVFINHSSKEPRLQPAIIKLQLESITVSLYHVKTVRKLWCIVTPSIGLFEISNLAEIQEN